MTICIAAAASYGSDQVVFVVADRMVTVGDIEYEPLTAKYFSISNSIMLLPAGDYNLHTELVDKLSAEMAEWIEANPGSWPRVGDFADRYRALYAAKKRAVWEHKFLFPIGLDLDTFHLADQQTKDRCIRGITDDLLPDISAIITGIDPSRRAQIWTVSNDDEPQDQTRLGYAAVGYGARHAETQFRLAGHAQSASPNETLWLTYFAKRRSEVAPSVGVKQDFAYIGPSLGRQSEIADEVIDKMGALYESIVLAEQDAQAKARSSLGEFVENRAAQAEAAQVPPSDAGNLGVTDETKESTRAISDGGADSSENADHATDAVDKKTENEKADG